MVQQKQFLLLFTLAFSAVLFSSCSDGKNPAAFTGQQSITKLSPDSGYVGDKVQIFGRGFIPGTTRNIVTFNGIRATVTSVNAEILVTSVPQKATSGPIELTIGGKTITGPYFTVLRPGPVITGVAPDHGGPGTQVTIIGKHLLPAGLMKKTLGDSSASQQQSAAPSAKASAVRAVKTPADSLPSDTLTIIPDKGARKSPMVSGVRISVSFGQTLAPILSLSDTKVVVKVPEDATGGVITLKVGDKMVQSSDFRLVRPPVISKVNPKAAPRGSKVTIKGKYFSPTKSKNTVTFNGTKATVKSASTTKLVVTVPQEATNGLIKVQVGSQTVEGPTFTVTETPVPQLQITKISPKQGPVGTQVTITGENFSGDKAQNTVTFNGTQATVSSASQTKLVVTVPRGATNGPVKVTANGQTAAGPSFSVIPDPDKQLAITGLSPKKGPVGTRVTIIGQNFSSTKSNNTVTFNGTQATVNSASTTEITVSVPKGATTGNVNVTVGNQTATGPTFTVTDAPVPQVEISDINPKEGPVGTEVTINGQNFSNTKSENTVIFNGTKATIKTASKTKLVVTVPNGATDGPVKVQVGNQTASGPSFDVIQDPSKQLKITKINPKKGHAGTEVTISGKNFSPDKNNNTVTFNGTKASIKNASTTQLVVTVPKGATDGPVKVTVGKQTASGSSFNVTQDPSKQLAITAISPKKGPAGTQVTIEGQNFSKTKAENTVTFNGIRASVQSVSTTKLTVKVPNKATTGAVKVQVGNQVATGPTFTVTEQPIPQVKITNISPKSGPVGTSITITGQNFSPDKNKNTITFNGTEAAVISASKTKLVVTVPQNATDGLVKVAARGQTASGPTFDVTQDPSKQLKITKINPKEGPVGTQVMISGKNFSSAKAENTVTFNGIEASIQSASPTKLMVTVPNNATSGPVKVTVGNQTATGPTFNVTQNHAPAITGSKTAFDVEENSTAVATIRATDPDGDALTYAISGGADKALFTIDGTTGKLSFKNSPDYENPGDTGGDNGYEVQVQASDESLTDTQVLTITVTDVLGPITFTGASLDLESGPKYVANPPDFVFGEIPEGTNLDAGNDDISIYAKVTERDLNSGGSNLSVQISGPDASFFDYEGLRIIFLPDGKKRLDLSMRFTGAPPDYENPVDAGADNTYKFKVTITDTRNGDAFSQEFTIPISDANEVPAFTGDGSFSLKENTTTIGTVTATDPNDDALTYAISGGDDAWAFSIDPTSGTLSFTGTPDHENPADANYDNTYQAQIQVTDGAETATQNLMVTLQDVARDPYYSAGQIFVDEVPYNPINHAPNSFGIVYTNSIPDGTDLSPADDFMFDFSLIFKAPDMPASGGSFTLGGPDQDSFQIVYENYGSQSSIQLKFTGGNNGVVDYQNPQDANQDNKYIFTIIIDDGTHNPPSRQTFILPIGSN